MLLDVSRLLNDNSIPYDSNGDWYNIQCPFCDDHSHHCGIATSGAVNCWRCGTHKILELISTLFTLQPSEARRMVKRYTLRDATRHNVNQAGKMGIYEGRSLTYPTGTGKMTFRHQNYLEKRSFDPDKLEREWGLLGTGPTSHLNGLSVNNRILAPIRYLGQDVSWQARSIGPEEPKYITCPKESEARFHKSILYGLDKAHRTCVVVEGITDVWRLGPGAVATFGIKFTMSQVELLARTFERVFVFYDQEEQALEQAHVLASWLPESVVAEIDGVDDPGGMDQEDADHLMRELVG